MLKSTLFQIVAMPGNVLCSVNPALRARRFSNLSSFHFCLFIDLYVFLLLTTELVARVFSYIAALVTVYGVFRGKPHERNRGVRQGDVV